MRMLKKPVYLHIKPDHRAAAKIACGRFDRSFVLKIEAWLALGRAMYDDFDERCNHLHDAGLRDPNYIAKSIAKHGSIEKSVIATYALNDSVIGL